jgi:hypothetical protein
VINRVVKLGTLKEHRLSLPISRAEFTGAFTNTRVSARAVW